MSSTNTSLFLAEHDPGDDPLYFEKTLHDLGFQAVGGVDEAGRGPLAGPVVAACVVLPQHTSSELYQDSKQLSASRREYLYNLLIETKVPLGIGIVDAREIEQMNILQASLFAMKKAVLDCNAALEGRKIDFLLVDGKFKVPLPLDQQALIKGDSRSRSIAAGSIVAKVTRDRLMAGYHSKYPEYNFLKNQGYPTAEHRKAIELHGPCPIHRRTFKGVREFCRPDNKPATVQTTLW